ncbi:hypothetical protein BS636_08990 [Acinetobacter sp. LoGeW2-3]|uniref:hypothetical protein n=1 Tax=Acinetobacter sp. LoGeW2-3 TaxID=1808001 RepID=UPI000C05A767|nr:hypothetical protein [Acinetobacter sp. LoGeW2-3]ATO19776.1 hypothetical protein BS636_08990 [Acinetobacter sp. LoGeW2-3]
MVKVMFFICSMLVLYAGWMIAFKIYKARYHGQRLKPETLLSSQNQAPISAAPKLHELAVTVDAYELELFDDIAKMLFKQQAIITERAQAEILQQKWLNRMPLQTNSVIRKMDLGEWSIYWNFYGQSIEYYVGRYGVFYTHVDRNGEEHRHEHRFESDHAHCA